MNVQLGETSNPEGGQMPQLGQFTNQKEINCQLQDEANIRVCQKEKEHQETGQEIVEEVAGQDLFQLWQVNVEDELSESADAAPKKGLHSMVTSFLLNTARCPFVFGKQS